MSMHAAGVREAALEGGGHAKGVAVAIVKQNKDDSGLGRVRVSYPWHTRPQESYWARVAMPMAGGKRGTYFIPEVEDEVLVAFERGDLRFPYVVGSLWNGVDKAPEANGDGKNDRRVIRTRKGHTLAFDDGERGSVELALSDGKKLRLDDDGVTVDDGQGNRVTIASTSGGLTIEAAGTLTLKAPQVVIQASGTLEAKASGTLTLGGAVVAIN
jgi:uncharacterized protein involved in type VI secretion and phage assembly